MELKVKRVHPEAKLPAYGHAGDAGLDLFSVVDLELGPGDVISVPTGIQVAIPPGQAGLIWDKSGISIMGVHRLAGVIDAFSHLAWVQHAFAGIRVCVCVLIFNAVLKLWKGAVKDVWGLVIFLAILALSVFTKLSPIIYVLAAAVAGLLIKNLGAKRS